MLIWRLRRIFISVFLLVATGFPLPGRGTPFVRLTAEELGIPSQPKTKCLTLMQLMKVLQTHC